MAVKVYLGSASAAQSEVTYDQADSFSVSTLENRGISRSSRRTRGCTPKSCGSRNHLRGDLSGLQPACSTPAVSRRMPTRRVANCQKAVGFQNLVARWFAELTNRKLRRSAHRSVTELETDIRKWITEWNKDLKPFVWTKTADEILETLAAYCGLITGSGH